MIEISCPCCNGKEFREENGKRVCAYCGTAYISETSNTTIALDADVKRLLAKCKSDPRRAYRYASLVLDIDPGNREALKYL